MTDRKRKKFEDEIVARRPNLVKRARKWVTSADTEDLVQQAYVTMLSHADWENIRLPVNWALGVVDGIGRNWKRKQDHLDTHRTDVFDRLENIRGNEDSIIDRIIKEEDTDYKIGTIADAMKAADLTRSENYVLLARLKGVEYDEIAETLGLGRESVVTYYSNAICKIRRSIGDKNLYKTDTDQGDQND